MLFENCSGRNLKEVSYMVWGFKNLTGMEGGFHPPPPPPVHKIRVKPPLTLKLGMVTDIATVYLKIILKS